MDQHAGAAAVASLACPSCALVWQITARAGGVLPQRSRCPVARGGCGTLVRVSAATVSPPAAAPPAAAGGGWDPPAQPRQRHEVAQACSACSGPLTATPRGTQRVCLACPRRVIPVGVQAPYERGEGQARVVRSQAERDLDAIALARRKGVMLAELEDLAGGEQLHPESLPVIEWFTAEVRAAGSDTRLDQLAELLPQADLRRRGPGPDSPAGHDFPGLPRARGGNLPPEIRATAAIAGSDAGPAALPAAPAPAIDYAAAMTRRGYYVDDDYAPPGGCQIIEDRGAAPTCPLAAVTVLPGVDVRVCELHHHALTPPAPAAPAPVPVTIDGALEACGWRLAPAGDGCQITEAGRLCAAEVRHMISTRYIRHAWVCNRHYYALCKVIHDAERTP